MKTIFFVVAALVCLLRCQTIPAPTTQNPPPPPPPTSTDTPTPVASLSWESSHPERAAWSKELRSQIADVLPAFDAASDRTSFCPKYASLTTAQRIDVWATMAVKIVYLESGYDPNNKYYETTMGIYSIGLFQLSYEDKMKWCNMNPLTDPIVNIRCAIPEMKWLVNKDGVVATGSGSSSRGLARYWSTMRQSGHYSEIVAVTRALSYCK